MHCVILLDTWIPRYDANTSKVNYYFDRGLILLIVLLLGISPVVTIHYLLFRMDMTYPNSLLPVEWGTHPVIYWGFCPSTEQILIGYLHDY